MGRCVEISIFGTGEPSSRWETRNVEEWLTGAQWRRILTFDSRPDEKRDLVVEVQTKGWLHLFASLFEGQLPTALCNQFTIPRVWKEYLLED